MIDPTLDPVLTQQFARIAEMSAHQMASSVSRRIQASRARRDQDQTITELTEIIQELLTERSEMLLIAGALKERLVAQSVDAASLKYITDTVIPTVETLAAQFGGEDDEGTAQALAALKGLFSKEILTVLQVLGFNYKQAVGAPLTALAEAHLLRLMPQTVDQARLIKELQVQEALTKIAVPCRV